MSYRDNPEDLEIAQGEHYHAWWLLPSGTRLYNGQFYSHLVYTPSATPIKDRSTARRWAKRDAEAEYGPSGYMALKCGGPPACPFFHNPFPLEAQEADSD